MNHDLGHSILELIEKFDEPISELSNAIAAVDSPQFRSLLDKALGEVKHWGK